MKIETIIAILSGCCSATSVPEQLYCSVKLLYETDEVARLAMLYIQEKAAPRGRTQRKEGA
jgi:hypothetical protein